MNPNKSEGNHIEMLKFPKLDKPLRCIRRQITIPLVECRRKIDEPWHMKAKGLVVKGDGQSTINNPLM